MDRAAGRERRQGDAVCSRLLRPAPLLRSARVCVFRPLVSAACASRCARLASSSAAPCDRIGGRAAPGECEASREAGGARLRGATGRLAPIGGVTGNSDERQAER